jgi:hypothetical protein
MDPKGEPDTKMNWSTDRQPKDKLNSTSLPCNAGFIPFKFTCHSNHAYALVSKILPSSFRKDFR